METNMLIFLIIAIVVIIIVLLQYSTLSKLKKTIEESNTNVKYLKSELEKINLIEKDVKHQLKAIKEDQIEIKYESLNKDISNLNQITSFSQLNHDIRTQLNGIIAFSNMLETEYTSTNNKEFLEYASNIRICGENLLKLFS